MVYIKKSTQDLYEFFRFTGLKYFYPGIQGVLKHYKMLLFYGGLCVNFDIIGEISHGSNRTRTFFLEFCIIVFIILLQLTFLIDRIFRQRISFLC